LRKARHSQATGKSPLPRKRASLHASALSPGGLETDAVSATTTLGEQVPSKSGPDRGVLVVSGAGPHVGLGMGGRTLPAGTVTLLFTDIEGSTRLIEELGEDGYVQALEGRPKHTHTPRAHARA
jgi:class 3 adenylate cyclase